MQSVLPSGLHRIDGFHVRRKAGTRAFAVISRDDAILTLPGASANNTHPVARLLGNPEPFIKFRPLPAKKASPCQTRCPLTILRLCRDKYGPPDGQIGPPTA